MDNFLIVGLPRSRTSWLANLFTYGPCFCVHDGLLRKRYWEDAVEDWIGDRPWIKHVGNADSGAPNIVLPRTDRKVIAVFRDAEAARQSFVKYFSERPYPQFGAPDPNATTVIFNHLALRFQQFVSQVPHDKLFTINFAELDSVDHVEAMWNFICPEEPFFRERYFELNNLRVNPASEKVRV